MKIFCTCTSRPEKAANPPTGDDGIPRLPLLLLLIYAMIAHEYLLNVAYLIACARVRTSVRPKHGRRKIFDEYGGVVTSCIRINRRARKTFYKQKKKSSCLFRMGRAKRIGFFPISDADDGDLYYHWKTGGTIAKSTVHPVRVRRKTETTTVLRSATYSDAVISFRTFKLSDYCLSGVITIVFKYTSVR